MLAGHRLFSYFAQQDRTKNKPEMNNHKMSNDLRRSQKAVSMMKNWKKPKYAKEEMFGSDVEDAVVETKHSSKPKV